MEVNILISAFLNIGTVLLGLLSCLFAVKAMGCYHKPRLGVRWSLLSFSCCANALLFQIVEIAHRASLGDMSAILDTIVAVAVGAVILVMVSLVLNILAYRNERKN